MVRPGRSEILEMGLPSSSVKAELAEGVSRIWGDFAEVKTDGSVLEGGLLTQMATAAA